MTDGSDGVKQDRDLPSQTICSRGAEGGLPFLSLFLMRLLYMQTNVFRGCHQCSLEENTKQTWGLMRPVDEVLRCEREVGPINHDRRERSGRPRVK